MYKRRFPNDIPTGRSVLSLFISYGGFKAIPKPDLHRAFFVVRDPRDIVVSEYYSLRNSHAPMGDIPQVRKVLRDGNSATRQRKVLEEEGSFQAVVEHLRRETATGALSPA